MSPYDEWESPPIPDWFGWLNDIFAGLSLIIGLAVGVVLSAVALKFIPDKRLAAAVLVVVWVAIILGFGFMEVFI